MPVQVECSLDCRVSPPYNDDIAMRMLERLGIVVRYLRKILADNPQPIGSVEVPRRDDDEPCLIQDPLQGPDFKLVACAAGKAPRLCDNSSGYQPA
jgi:hypothetical protein